MPSASDYVATGYWGNDTFYYAPDSSLTVSNDALVAAAGQGYLTGVNLCAPQLVVAGDFGMTMTVKVSSGGGAWLTFAGGLGTGPNYWNGAKSISFGVGQGRASAYWYDGTGPNTAGSLGFNGGPFSGAINLEILRQAGQLIFSANGTTLGQMSDLGLFASGKVYVGLNVAPGSQLTISGWAAEAPIGQPGNVQVILPAAKIASSQLVTPFLSLTSALGLWFGTSGTPGQIAGASFSPPGSSGLGPYYFPTGAAVPAFRQNVAENWNTLVVDYCRWGNFLQPAQGQFLLGGLQFYSDFAANNAMVLHMAAPIQASGCNPTWLTGGTFTRDQLLSVMQTEMQTVMGSFKGKIGSYDVVNEPFNSDGTWNTTASPWAAVVGTDYVAQAFQFAHAADPTAELYLNEVVIENAGPKADAIYNLAKELVAAGVPITGIGMESHFYPGYYPIPSEVEANMRRLADLGLRVRISEMDVQITLPASPADLQNEAQAYANMATACLVSANCNAFVTYDPDDRDSWIPGNFPGKGSADIFDANWQPKPAYQALVNVFSQASAGPKLTTNAVASAASYANESVAPGELVTLFPSNAGPATIAFGALDSSGKLATSVAGVQVLFDGNAAPIVYAVSGQVTVVVPYEVGGESATQVQVANNGVLSLPATIPVVPAIPAIFTVNSKGTGQAAAVNQNGSNNSADNPAARGSIVVIYATGEGLRTPAVGDGVPSAANEAPVLPVSVTVGGLPAQLLYAASAPGFVGLMQINLIVPAALQPGPAVAVVVTVGSAQSASATVAVQ